MANADLVLRFKAENADLKRAFKESTKEIQTLNSKISGLDRQFKKSSASTIKSVEAIKTEILNTVPAVGSFVSGFTKMGVAAGAVKLVADGIKSLASEALNAGQGMDAFNNTMAAVKDTYSVLASSLLAGDFSNFGEDIFKANLELANFRDTLDDVGRSYGYVSGAANAALAEAQAVIIDKKSSPEQIQNAISKVKTEIADLERISANKTEIAQGILKSFAAGQGHANLKDVDYDNIFRNFSKYDQIAEDKKAYDNAVAYNKNLTKYGNLGSSATGTNSIAKKKVNIPKLNYTKEELEIAAFVADISDNERDELMRMYQEMSANAREINTMKKVLERIVNKDAKLNTDKAADFQPGSIADLDKQIADIDTRLKNENLDFDVITKLVLDKKSLEKTKEKILSQRELYGNLLQIPVAVVTPPSAIDTAGWGNEPLTVDKNFSVGKAPTSKNEDKSGDKISGINKQIEAYGTLADSIAGVASATGDADSKLAEYASSFAQLMGLLPPIITAIQTLTAVNTVAAASSAAVSAANTTEAGTATTAAVANTAKENSKLGPVGWIMAIAAGASLLAFILSVKNKFAEGGIVPGSSFSGDKILARLNSGEMVLNRGQQSRLFDMINLGARESAGATAVTGEFRLRGTDLIGVINNTKRKRSV